ncbi:hypothetical protein H4219_005898 [Mycoemilia scoparia]|uniref:ABC transporter domain-containing protein n=1 Tax=Mycoemilia scoparia TaxID=417184 RepID=A0A9W7ZKW1_9FUNG|nr:hypothetical protein H4219_005898 [Mycoemilia scoparia]
MSTSAAFYKKPLDDRVSPLQVTFENLSYYVTVAPQPGDKKPPVLERVKNTFTGGGGTEKCILKNMSGSFQPGRLCAIMGPSGSGKTSMLNLLSGFTSNGRLEGNIWVNGRTADNSALRMLTAYVNQEDIILPTQTVKEAVAFSTALRLPCLDKNIQSQRCQEAINLLSLEHTEKTVIGDDENKGVSGGERKRVAIAMELVTDASILLLDEPTSGLDSHTAITVAKLMKKIALTGRTVVTVIHQPSIEIFNMFDDLLIMKEGRIAYMGEREGCMPFFAQLGYICPKSRNPADYLLTDVLNRPRDVVDSAFLAQESKRLEKLTDAWDHSSDFQKQRENIEFPVLEDIHESSFKRMRSLGTQIKQLVIRDWNNMTRNKLLLNIRLIQIAVFALIGGMVFYNSDSKNPDVQSQNFQGASFYIILTEFFVTAITVLNTYSPQRSLFRREFLNGYYNIHAYFISKVIIELPIHIIGSLIYSAIMYWMVGFQKSAGKYFLFAAVAIAERLCGFALGVHLACFFVDLALAISVIPLLVVPFMAFGGMLVNPGEMPGFIKWCQWISPVKYGYAALAINQFDGLEYKGQDIGSGILDKLNLGRFGVAANIGFILMFSAVFTIQAYISLVHLVRQQGIKKNKKKSKDGSSDPRAIILGPPEDRFINNLNGIDIVSYAQETNMSSATVFNDEKAIPGSPDFSYYQLPDPLSGNNDNRESNNNNNRASSNSKGNHRVSMFGSPYINQN